MSSAEEPASSMWAVQPSDGATISTEQQAHFHRISVVIVNTGSRVLRKILLQELPSGQDLRAFLISNDSKLEELHRRRVPVITYPQMKLLHNCPDLEKFDVTLLVCLLRNIVNVQAPATGWKKPPNPSDTSLGADLLRIRLWRNRIAHSSAVGMKNEEFNQLWNEVEPVLVRMSPEGEERNSIQQEIADGKRRLLDTFTEREKHLCDILVKWYKMTFEDVDKNLKDVMDQFVELKLDATDARLERDEISRTLGNMEQAWNQLQEEFLPRLQAEALLKQNRPEAQTNLNIAESPENVAHRLSEEVRLLRYSLPTNIETSLNRIEEELRKIQFFQERQTSLSSEAMGNNQTERNQERHALAEVNQTQHRSSNEMTDIEIVDVVRELSASWKVLALSLGYRSTQTDTLEEIYGNKPTNKIHAMLSKWHSVVMQFGEDPKLLLAKACCNIQNKLLATQILGEERFEREDLENVKMNPPLEEAIKRITFDEQPDGRQQSLQRIQEEERREEQEGTMKLSAESLLLLYAELKDNLRRDQCRVIAKDIAAERPLPAEEKASFQEMTKRRDLVDWLLKYVLSQKDELILKIFCESLGKQSPSLGQTLQKTSVQKHELVKTERQPTTLRQDELHFLQRSFNSKLVVDIIIDKLLSGLLITVEEHSSIRSSSNESEMTKRLEALLQCDTEITQQFKRITQPFRDASVSQTADWLVPLHAQAKETLSCGKGLAIATDIFQQIPGIISRTDFYELFKLKDSSRDVIDRLLKLIYRQPQPEVFDVICYSLKEHDEGLYEHFLRTFFFKAADKEKGRPGVNRDRTLPSGRGTGYLYNIIRNRQTLDVVIDHLLSSLCITVDQHSDIRNDDSINWSIKKLVDLLQQSPQTIVAVNAILRHLNKIADTKNTGDKEITISVEFGDLEVNSQTKKYMDSLCGQTLLLPDIGQFYLNDVKDGSVRIIISPRDRESLSRFRDMVTNGTIVEYLRDHIKVFLPDDVEINSSELSIGVIERTTSVPVQSASIIIDISSVDVYTMENEPVVQPSFPHQKYSKFIGSIRMFPEELLSQNTESNSADRGVVCAGQLGLNGEPLAIKQMLLGRYSESLKTYNTVKERLQHRNIVKIFCVEKDEKYGYVVMERMDENLVEYVARSCQHGHADMDIEEEIYYMKRIVSGLAFIHEKGCLHNMFSPTAILLKNNNPKQVSIACFSSAALGEHVPVSCKKGAKDVLALIKVLRFVLYKKENIVNGDIQADNRIIQSGHFDIFILLKKMLDSRTSDKLKLQEFALYPALSSPIVQLDFLKKSDRLRKNLKVDFNSTNRMNLNPWLYEPTLNRIVYQYIKDVPQFKKKPNSLNSLVHCIRNYHEHLSDIPPQVQREFGGEEGYIYYWLVKFPGLVSSVYEAMRPHKNRTALRRFFILD